MNSVKIIHTGDLHLCSARTGVKGGKAEIENTFFRIINICKNEKIDFLLIAGDLFDSPFVPQADATEIISAMSQIPDTVIAISAGNHDPACQGSVYFKNTFPENVIIFTSKAQSVEFPQKGVRLWGAGFGDRFETAPLLRSFNVEPSSELINLGVLHGEALSENSPSRYNPVYHSDIEKSGLDYLALGHIHKRSAIEQIGTCRYSYCGCPDGRGFDEIGSCGIYIGSISKQGCQLEYRELSSRQYIIDRVDISGCTTVFSAAESILAHIKTRFGEAFDRNLYRISVTGVLSIDSSLNPTQIQAILSESLYYIRIYDETDTDISDISKIAAEASIRGIFVTKMLERLQNTPEANQAVVKAALKLGLRAFSKEVKLNDN